MIIKDLVSVIVPNYNGADYIEECLESIINQDYKNIEILIVDDGSMDQSIELIQRFLKDDNIKLFEQVNMNASVARNRGLVEAKGEYIYFLDSDDTVNKEGISSLVKKMKEEKSDLAIGNYITVDKQGNFIRKKELDKNNINKNPLSYAKAAPNPSNKLYKHEICLENSVHWGNVKLGQDLNFFLKYLLCTKKVSYVEKEIYQYRILNSGISKSVNFNMLDIVEVFRDVKKFYEKNKKMKAYYYWIEEAAYEHYLAQLKKYIRFEKICDRHIATGYILNEICKLQPKKWKNSKRNNKIVIKRNVLKVGRPLLRTKLYMKII